MLIDLHLKCPPERRYTWLRASAQAGLDAVCLVGDGGRLPDQEAARAALPREGLMLFFGAEFRLQRGSLVLIPADLAGFESECSARRPTEYDEVLEVARRTGAAVIAGHPYDRSAGPSFADGVFQLEGLHAIEVVNGNRSEVASRLALEAAMRLHLAAVGGTGPANSPSAVGTAATVFAQSPNDQAALVEAIRCGKVFPVELGTLDRRPEAPRRAQRPRPRPQAEEKP